MRSLSGFWLLISKRGKSGSGFTDPHYHEAKSGSGFWLLISIRGESGCGLTIGHIQVLFWWSFRVCSVSHARHTSPKTKRPLWDPPAWLVQLHTCSVTHPNRALLWKALPLVRTATLHFCGSGVSATSFTTEQAFKADAGNVIAPFLTVSALQTMLSNTSTISMGLLRREAVCCSSLFPLLPAGTQIVSLTRSAQQQFVVDASERNGYCLSK